MAFFEIFEQRNMTTPSLIPIEQYDENLNAFVMRNEDRYMDIVQIISDDLMNKSDYEIDYLNMCWAKFYKTCAADIKLISLNFPTNTTKQQKYIEYKLNQTKNPVFKYFLQNKLSELIQIGKNRSDREYYIMYFAKSAEQLKDIRDIFSSSLMSNGLCCYLDKEKKLQILYKFNNPNSALFKPQEVIEGE